MYSTTGKLWEFAKEKRELTNVNDDGDAWDADFVEYSFKDDLDAAKRPASQEISYNFWDGYNDFNVEWTYNKANNTYLRANGGKNHIDRNNNKQLDAKNVVVLFMKESRANDGYEGNLHMLYGTKGTGSASVFIDGKEINAKWTKANRTSRLKLTDTAGKEIELNKGRIWFSIVSPDTEVTVN